MKKVLFATTALVLSAGVAAAEVAVSGTGRMGVVYTGSLNDAGDKFDNDWNFSSRARVIFDLSGQTDGGLEFGGSFRADQSADANKGGAGSVFVSGAFGKIEMGDTVSAPEALFGDLPEIGYEDLSSVDTTDLGAGDYSQGLLQNDIPYLTGDSAGHIVTKDGVIVSSGIDAVTSNNNPVVLYTYSTGPLSLAASMSDGNGADGISKDNQEYAAAAAYTFDAYTIGLGYEMFDPEGGDKQAQGELAGTATFGNTDLKAYYAWGNQANIVDKAFGLGFTSKFGPTSVMGYVQKVDFVDGLGLTTVSGDAVDDVVWWGLGAAYDLGGGASVVGGISDNDLDGSDVTADLGMKFKF